MRIAILWIELTGYLNACLRELASRSSVDLFVAHRPPDPNSPFSTEQFAWLPRQFVWRSAIDLASLPSRLHEFCPDVLVIAGWAVPAYRKVALEWKSRAVRIMTMDNCWQGTLSQWGGRLTARYFVQALAEAIWVPGERQAAFASKLLFKQSNILRGMYSCDYAAFSAVYENRMRDHAPLKRAFAFVGRLIERKGIRTLAQAYRLYRTRTPNPWPLICHGLGPLATDLAGEAGVEIDGFIPPEKLPEKLAQAACLVVPSTFEPWALVVHEATAAGLLVLASVAVGAVPHLVQQNYNGYVFDRNDPEGLALLLQRVSSLSDEKLDSMSAASASLARQFTPVRWSDALLQYADSARCVRPA